MKDKVYYPRRRLKSRYRGVRWQQSREPDTGEWREGHWKAEITVNGVTYFCGEFTEEFEVAAAKARDLTALRLLGLDAKLNFPLE